ncbi:MAG: DUF4398 domain-containing protein, partial [Vicinamibacterales bacterium]
MSRPAALACTLLALLLSAGCAEPPSKEMNQAQGAIDTARAAGAAEYATEEFNAAVEALQRSEAAVADGDYRLALNHALDSRERAQNAAKLAVEGRAQARGDAERVVDEVSALLTRAEARLADPEVGRVPRRALAAPRATIESASTTLQEARAALAADDYAGANTAIDGVAADLQAALAALDPAVTAQPARR